MILIFLLLTSCLVTSQQIYPPGSCHPDSGSFVHVYLVSDNGTIDLPICSQFWLDDNTLWNSQETSFAFQFKNSTRLTCLYSSESGDCVRFIAWRPFFRQDMPANVSQFQVVFKKPTGVRLHGLQDYDVLFNSTSDYSKLIWKHYEPHEIVLKSKLEPAYSFNKTICSPLGKPQTVEAIISEITESSVLVELPMIYVDGCTDFRDLARALVKIAESGNIVYEASHNYTNLKFNVSDLRPFTKYDISLTIFNGDFYSEAGRSNFTTNPTLPGKPVFTKAIASYDRILVYFNDNGNANGPSIQFILTYRYCHMKVNMFIKSVKRSATQLSAPFIDNVAPARCYTVDLYMENEIGVATDENRISVDVKTEHITPSPPLLLTVDPVGTDMLNFTWLPAPMPVYNGSQVPYPPVQFEVCSFPSLAELDQRNNFINSYWSSDARIYAHMNNGELPNSAPSDRICVPVITADLSAVTSLIEWDPFKNNTQDGKLTFAMRATIARINNSQLKLVSLLSNGLQFDAVEHGFVVYIPRYLSVILLMSIFGLVTMIICIVCFVGISRYRTKLRHYQLATPVDSANGFTGGYLPEQVTNGIAGSKKCHVMQRFENTSHKPIPVTELLDTIWKLHADGNLRFQTEFEDLEKASNHDWPAVMYKQPCNVAKNRYSNIYPYDHTRVIMGHLSPGAKFNYINANYVDGFHRQNAYIATQGPLPQTIDDFWQMVWEHKTNIIVMTSQFLERARRKCDQYWPDEGSHLYGNVSVRIVSQHLLAYFVIRTFVIKNTRLKKSVKERIVFHYQYTDWADFDVPLTPLPVLAFVRASVRHWTAEDGPIVVHCSAGVGRTGTYICIESLIRQMDKEHAVNIRGFLEHIRQQRMKLVQTEAQYAFIHDSLAEYLLCPLHEIPQSQFKAYAETLRMEKSTKTGQTFMECQFQIITAGSFGRRIDLQYDFSVARHPDNQVKNRSQMLVPLDSNRVNLSVDMSQGRSSNYINASVLLGYRRLDEFIVTQHPLEDTVKDFWRMVWEKNSPLVICFSNDREDSPSLENFWPVDSSDIREIGWLRIAFIRQGSLFESVVTHEFLLSSTREDYALPCHLWLVQDSNQESHLMEMISLSTQLVQPRDSTLPNAAPSANASTNHTNTSLAGLNSSDLSSTSLNPLDSSSLAAQFISNSHGPTILVDELGASMGGTFCALVFLINQIVHDGIADVYYIAKMLNIQRPGIWQSCDDLDKLYNLVELFIAGLVNNQYPHLMPLPQLSHNYCEARSPANGSVSYCFNRASLSKASDKLSLTEQQPERSEDRFMTVPTSPPFLLSKYRVPKTSSDTDGYQNGGYQPISLQACNEHESLQLLSNMLIPREAAFTHYENSHLFTEIPKQDLPPSPMDVMVENLTVDRDDQSHNTTVASIGPEDEIPEEGPQDDFDDDHDVDEASEKAEDDFSSLLQKVDNMPRYVNDFVDAAPITESTTCTAEDCQSSEDFVENAHLQPSDIASSAHHASAGEVFIL